MSKVEVNQISSQCGSTLTIGQSGDTVTLACGATQTGFGRTGTVNWDTTAKTASFTAVSGNGYFVNTTSGVITVTLPAGSAGDIISLADYAATWQTNSVIVTPNGTDKIGGENVNVTLTTEGQSVTFVYTDSTQGWLNTMDSTSNVRGNPNLVATGGTVTCCGDYKIHTFTGPGTFTVTNTASVSTENIVSYLVIAGGGSGATRYGGGGGAGGFREYKGPADCYTASPLNGNPGGTAVTVTAQAYPITVGGGGSGVSCNDTPATTNLPGNRGSNSIFSTIISTGGGGGIGQSQTTPTSPLSPGGSGGGGTYNPSFGAGNTPPVSPSQGNNGGTGIGNPNYSVGGGGGAGAVGGNGSPTVSGAGGNGVATSITGSSVTRAGGGGGGGSINHPISAAPGGTGGGTAGGSSPGSTTTAGTANTGGGSGGAYGYPGNSGNGGSGIVIIRYKFQ
jgi:hypothetical protein